MKVNGSMRTTILPLLLMYMLLAGCSSQRMSAGIGNPKQDNWYNDSGWLNGLQLKPHASVNRKEFIRQYNTRKVWWDEAFAFLKTHDLDNIKAGVYVVDSGNVIATVSEVAPKDKEQVNFEAHRNFNDLQYVIKGKAQMGVAAITGPDVKVTVPYSDKADTETFAVAGGDAYYTAEPGSFFIFSPKDLHRPAFKLAGYDTIKKVVIKVRVP